MVDLAAFATPILSGAIGGSVGVVGGYWLHYLRVKREDAREDRDHITGPLLREVGRAVEAMEGDDPTHFSDVMQNLSQILTEGRLNPRRLKDLKRDVEIVRARYSDVWNAYAHVGETVDAGIQRYLRDKVKLIAVQVAGSPKLGEFPYDDFSLSGGHWRKMVAKDWDALVSLLVKKSNRPEWSLSAVVDWNRCFEEHRKEFEDLADDFVAKRKAYLGVLRVVKSRLDLATSDIYTPYKSAIDKRP